MKEKLLKLLQNEGLKSGQFAEMVGVNPAGISHILAGRNKPGFDLLQKILRTFPRINPDWLLLDSEQMYRDDESQDSSSEIPTPEKTLGENASASSVPNNASSASQNSSLDSALPAASPATCATNSPRQVERVIVLYTDGSCESYTPNK